MDQPHNGNPDRLSCALTLAQPLHGPNVAF